MSRNEFIKRWLEIFAKDILKSQIDKYVKATGNYIWHIFSWRLLDKSKYSEGEEAIKAFENADKTGACYLDCFNCKVIRPLTADLYTAEALDNFIEVYVVSHDFSWTYIKTHEGDMCGPYFMMI